MKNGIRILAVVSTTLMVLLLIAVAVLLGNQKVCDEVPPEETDNLLFFTDKSTYQPGKSVTFTLMNNGSENILYDTSLGETLQIFSSSGEIIVMEPWLQDCGLSSILPGESRTWTWNQTYYIYIQESLLNLTLDYRSWTQVTPQREYTARINFEDIEKEVDFNIGD